MIYIFGAYVFLCVVLFIFQNRFVFHPTVEAAVSPQDNGFGRTQARAIETRTSDGVTLKGWHVASRGEKEAVTLDLPKAFLVDLFFCGNAGNRADRTPAFQRIIGQGVHAVCFDYRGYGDSEGSPSEEGLAKDARAAWDFLIQQGVSANNIVLHGESLGGAVAIRLAAELCAEGTVPAGLITEATFTRLSAPASRQFPFVPVSLLLTSRFPSVERIGKVTCPILMIHGSKDSLVTLEIAKELFTAAPQKSRSGLAKAMVEMPQSGHNDIARSNAREYMDALRAFYCALCPPLVVNQRDPNERPKRERKTPTPRKAP